MSTQPSRGPLVIDTDVYGAGLVPGSTLAVIYQPIIVGRPAFISFQTAAELRFGALRRNWGDSRMRKLEARIAAAETIHTGPDLVLTYARLRVDCERFGHALSQREHTADRWIAATALRLGIPLVSNDGIFHNVPGLLLEQRRMFQRFSASSELMGFLLHFDNRSGLSDTGPYPTADGGFVIVRDHFLSEGAYPWVQLAPDLPYAVTQAMYFEPDEPMELALIDISTLFTEPANYLRHLKGAAVYARDRWDTRSPTSDCWTTTSFGESRLPATAGTRRLYPHIAAMSRREKIMAGAQAYYTDFILPYARAAGMWDRLVNEHDFFEIDRVASEAYYPLVVDGAAAELVPRLFLTGAGFPDIPPAGVTPGLDPAILTALHAMALRGSSAEVPGGADGLVADGLLLSTKAGYTLTEEGRHAHHDLLHREREQLDLEGLAAAYERFLGHQRSVQSAEWSHQRLGRRRSLRPPGGDGAAARPGGAGVAPQRRGGGAVRFVRRSLRAGPPSG